MSDSDLFSEANYICSMARKRLNKVVQHIEIRDINTKGMGVAKSDKGEVYFIKNTVPGDIVDIRVYKKRRGYFEAEPLKWIQYSKERVTPQCKHFGVCGGCKWQHLAYEAQLNYKEKGVLHNLKSIGKIDPEVVLPAQGVDYPYYYRNKMEFSFSSNRWLTNEEIKESGEIERNGLGFHKPQMWDKIVDITHCYLQADPSNEIRNEIKIFALKHKMTFYNAKTQQGFLRTLMIRNSIRGEIMVLLQFFEDQPQEITMILNFIKDRFPEVSSLLYCINQKANDTLYDQDIHCFHGADYITEHMGSLAFKITAKSFFQTNPKQAQLLYQIASEFATLQPNETVYDLYTGTGTIALFLAKNCKKIIGIEAVPDAIHAARENAIHNKIENAFFEVGDMKKYFNADFIQKYGRAEVVITDPPREGMHKEVVQQLLKLAPERIVYISCNSATQARDLELMNTQYRIVKSQAVDMFPQTHHIENIVLLHLKHE